MKSSLRDDLAEIRDAALKAVDPGVAVARALRRAGNVLTIGTQHCDLSGVERVALLAVGKAAPAMAAEAVRILDGVPLTGGIITKVGHVGAIAFPGSLFVVEAGHPVPDRAGLQAAQRVIELLQTTTSRDLVLLLLSGGGSALLPSPVDSLTLEDLQTMTSQLLRAGATINELNAVRKHCSRLQGGQLARLALPAPVYALILSDVVGDPLDVIASGPTAPDPTTFADALGVLLRYDLARAVPAAILNHLNAGAAGALPDTPKPSDPLFAGVHNLIIGSNRQAALAAKTCAQNLGYNTVILSTFIEGEAREIAKVAVALARGIRSHGDPLTPPACAIWGGETTVTVRGPGKGGRNQELALAAAIGLDGMSDLALMALATDGTDGPTDVAGAVVDGATASQAAARGLSLDRALRDNDSYSALDALGALLRTGPTGTNVNDLLVLLAR